MPPNRVSEIIRERRDVTADTALRLGRYFNVEPQLWLNFQIAHDLSKAQAQTDYSSIKPLPKKRAA